MSLINSVQFGCQMHQAVQFGAADDSDAKANKAGCCAKPDDCCDTDTVEFSSTPEIEVEEAADEVAEEVAQSGNKLMNAIKKAGKTIVDILLAPFKFIGKLFSGITGKFANRGELQDATELSTVKLQKKLDKLMKNKHNKEDIAEAINEAQENEGNIQSEALRSSIDSVGRAQAGLSNLSNAIELMVKEALEEADNAE